MSATGRFRLPHRAGRRTDLGLLVLLLLATGSSVLAFGVGAPAPSQAVVLVHAAGPGLLLVPWKAVVVGRARQRSPAGRASSAAVFVGVLVAGGSTADPGRGPGSRAHRPRRPRLHGRVVRRAGLAGHDPAPTPAGTWVQPPFPVQ